MAPRSRFTLAKKEIVRTFEQSERRVYTQAEIADILSQNRDEWKLPQSTTVNDFIRYLTEKSQLRLHRFKFPSRTMNRYSWGDASTMQVVQSLNAAGYFSHYSAIYLNGLTEQVPKNIYFNIEQRLTSGGGTFTQESIDRAFRNKCRVSNNIADYQEAKVTLLNGGNTKCLGVQTIDANNGESIRVTNIERTLIDATVRPVYSGGVFEVAKAFRNAHSRLSVNQLVSYLKTLNYTYPYHQAIGFYLEHAGVYSATQLSLLANLGVNHDFYLTHKMTDTVYNEKWRLHVPKGL